MVQPHHQLQYSKKHPQVAAKNRDSFREILMEANKSYIRSSEADSLRDSGAKRVKKETSSSSQHDLHIGTSFLEQELMLEEPLRNL